MKINAQGFDFDVLNGFAEEILETNAASYVNTIAELLDHKTIKSDIHKEFRSFIVNKDVNLKLRMGVASDYLELITISEYLAAVKYDSLNKNQASDFCSMCIFIIFLFLCRD